MRWLFLILAVTCFALLLKVQSLGIAIVLLIAMLGLLLAAVLSFVAARIDGRSRDHGQMVDVTTLTQIRQQAEQRKAAEQPESETAQDANDDDGRPVNPA